jgi:hypothetical protein
MSSKLLWKLELLTIHAEVDNMATARVTARRVKAKVKAVSKPPQLPLDLIQQQIRDRAYRLYLERRRRTRT